MHSRDEVPYGYTGYYTHIYGGAGVAVGKRKAVSALRAAGSSMRRDRKV